MNERIHDFGSMERYSKRRHAFLVKNAGKGYLTLQVRRTTCRCAVAAISTESCEPGGTVEIVVDWTGQTPTREPDFRQEVEITTNDPAQPLINFVITGYVTETIRAFPPDLVVGRVSSNEGAEVEFRLFGFRSEKIEILGTEFEDADAPDLFEVTFQPLPKEEVEKEKGASCGLLAKLIFRSGLPLGPINQTIRIRARAEKDATISVPVTGRVVSDIVMASSDKFVAPWNLLDFGPLKRTESARAVLQIFVRGDYRHETEFSVGEVDPPEYLKVDIGPPEELNQGRVVRHKVTIEVPAGLERIDRMGAEHARHGRVVLQTTHPTTKQIPIKVRFAVD